jgi:hypothetical protein
MVITGAMTLDVINCLNDHFIYFEFVRMKFLVKGLTLTQANLDTVVLASIAGKGINYNLLIPLLME